MITNCATNWNRRETHYGKNIRHYSVESKGSDRAGTFYECSEMSGYQQELGKIPWRDGKMLTKRKGEGLFGMQDTTCRVATRK